MPTCPLKCLESIKLHLPEELKRAIQDLAMQEERAVSEYIRVVLQLHVYGAKAKLPTTNTADQAR